MTCFSNHVAIIWYIHGVHKLVHCTVLWYLSVELKFLDFVSFWVTVNLKLRLTLNLELVNSCYCSDLHCGDIFCCCSLSLFGFFIGLFDICRMEEDCHSCRNKHQQLYRDWRKLDTIWTITQRNASVQNQNHWCVSFLTPDDEDIDSLWHLD
jgi:hypothetical protein